MAEESRVTSILKKERGREFTDTDEFEVEKGMIRRFALAVGDPHPLYYDEAFAAKTVHGGIIAPYTFPFEWNHHSHSVFSPERREALHLRDSPGQAARGEGG